MISQTTIEQVKSAAEIVSLIGESVKLKKEGSDYVGLCPFHNEKSGSFKVSPSKNFYKCFGCGVSGDAIKFVMETQRVKYIDAIKLLAEKYNIEVVNDATEESKKTYILPAERLEKLSKTTIDYFENHRKISNNTLLRFRVTESVEWMPKAKKEIKAICFNYYEQDKLVNIKFRGKDKDFKLAKDAKLVFYNIDAIEGVEEAIITEGEADCMSFYEAGEYFVVSVPNGAGVGNLKLEYLDNNWQYFDGKKKIYIATDSDEPGRRLCEELSRRLGKERCYIVNYPDGCKDANDVLVKYGKQAVKDLITNARLYPLEGESTIESMADKLLYYYQNGYPKGAKSGMLDDIGDTDAFLTIISQQLTIVTGIHGHGKDEFLNAFCTGLAKINHWKTMICQFEETPDITASKFMEKYACKSYDFRKNPEHRMNQTEFNKSMSFVDEYIKILNVDTFDTTIDSILDKAKQMVERYGINALVISPWNCIEHNTPSGMTTDAYTSKVLSQITSFLRKYNLHGFLVVHPTKMAKGVDGKYLVPTLTNCKGAAEFGQKTHNGITVYRNFDTGIVDVHIQKVKYSWLGRVGTRHFKFDPLTRQYSSIDTADTNAPSIIKDEDRKHPYGNFKPIESHHWTNKDAFKDDFNNLEEKPF